VRTMFSIDGGWVLYRSLLMCRGCACGLSAMALAQMQRGGEGLKELRTLAARFDVGAFLMARSIFGTAAGWSF